MFLSDLMLFNDDMHEFIHKYMVECKEEDAYNDKKLPLAKLEEIMD